MKDICAVSTPLAEGGISVIRISGENAISIGAKVFKPLSCKSVENMAGYTCAVFPLSAVTPVKQTAGQSFKKNINRHN